MDKNFILFFVIATAGIFLYYTLFPPSQPEEAEVAETDKQTEVVGQQSVGNQGNISKIEAENLPVPVNEEGAVADRKTITIDSNLYKIEIDTLDGVVTSHLLKDYKYGTEPHFDILDWGMSIFRGSKKEKLPYDPERLINMAGEQSEINRIWKVTAGSDNDSVVFRSEIDHLDVSGGRQILTLSGVLPSGLEVYKTLQFTPDSYQVDFETRIVNRTGQATQIAPRINFGAGNEIDVDETMPRPKTGCAYIDDDFEKFDDGDVENGMMINNALWAGVMDKFFVSVVRMADETTFKGEYTPHDSAFSGKNIIVPQLTYVDSMLTLGDGQEYAKRFQLFIGPKVLADLKEFDNRLPSTMDLGWFDFLAHPLLVVLRWLQKYVGNWGVAIILLTVIVRLVMSPLQLKGMSSMRRMSALNPQIKVIREKYKKDKERMNKEVMQFYSQNKISPVSGCLPMVLQIPIFIALYQALMPAIELRHAPFIFWVGDLAANDHTLILPILMGVSMFVQQTIMPMSNMATMDPMQQKMMKWMPVVMIVFFLRMPSGLVLYWVVSNLITIGLNYAFNKIMPAPAAPVVKKGGPSKTTKAKATSKATSKTSSSKTASSKGGKSRKKKN